MMEFVEGFANSEVLEAVHQRTDKVKMARTAKVEEMMKALNPKEAANAAKRVEKEAEVAAEKRKAEVAALAAKAALAVAGAKIAVLAFEAAARWKVIQEARRKVIQDVEPAAVPAAVSNDPFIRFQLRSQLHN